MEDTNASVFDMSDFTITRRIAQSYLDDVKVPIDEGAASGSRITGPYFLADIEPGQDQILIHSGNQSIHIDQSQCVRIKECRDTEVGQVEVYVNHSKYEHRVWGPYAHKHHNTTDEVHCKVTTIDYYDHVRIKELKGDSRIRNVEETIKITGTQHTEFYGSRSLYLEGDDSKEVYGHDKKRVYGSDFKAVYGIDSAYALVKNAMTFLDFKGSVFETKWFNVQGTCGVFMADVKGGLLRLGGMCAKVVGAAIGSIRF